MKIEVTSTSSCSANAEEWMCAFRMPDLIKILNSLGRKREWHKFQRSLETQRNARYVRLSYLHCSTRTGFLMLGDSGNIFHPPKLYDR